MSFSWSHAIWYQGRDCRHLFLRYIIATAERSKIEQTAMVGVLRRRYMYLHTSSAWHGTRSSRNSTRPRARARYATSRHGVACRTRENATAYAPVSRVTASWSCRERLFANDSIEFARIFASPNYFLIIFKPFKDRRYETVSNTRCRTKVNTR